MLNKVKDPDLKVAVNELYRPVAKTGDGGSAAELVREVDDEIQVTRANGNTEYPHQHIVISRINKSEIF